MTTLWQYDNSYLMHYGVLGMKWGIRRAQKNKQKAAQYKRYAEDYDPKGYTTKLSDKQRERAQRNYTKNLAKSKKYAAKAKKIEQKHKDRAGTKTYNRVKNTRTSKLVGESLVLGTYGALKYNQARVNGSSRGLSILNGLLHETGNSLTGGLASIVEPRMTADARRNRRNSD